MTDHWEAVRVAGRDALTEEAERRYPLDVSMHREMYNDNEVSRLAFVAGGEWATEQFVQAVSMKNNLSAQLSEQRSD